MDHKVTLEKTFFYSIWMSLDQWDVGYTLTRIVVRSNEIIYLESESDNF